MHMLPKLPLFALAAASAFGPLTMDQKVSDFLNVVEIYDKNYGPYEWKRDAIGFDLLNTGPWLDRIHATKDDLSFYEVMVSYVASLNASWRVCTRLTTPPTNGRNSCSASMRWTCGPGWAA